jgi:capsid protein
MPMGQPWIDPLKEIKADVEAVNYGLTTRADVIKRRTGRDFREVMDQLAAEQQYIRAAGIELGDPDVVKSEQTVDTDDSKEDPDNADA